MVQEIFYANKIFKRALVFLCDSSVHPNLTISNTISLQKQELAIMRNWYLYSKEALRQNIEQEDWTCTIEDSQSYYTRLESYWVPNKPPTITAKTCKHTLKMIKCFPNCSIKDTNSIHNVRYIIIIIFDTIQ